MAEKTSGISKPNSLRVHSAALRAPPSHWHAVVIKPKGQCCEAVQACRSARFLSSDAPRLPLEACTNSDTCSCVYKHHTDRRAHPRRQDEKDGLRRGTKVGQERRLTRDRRKPD